MKENWPQSKTNFVTNLWSGQEDRHWHEDYFVMFIYLDFFLSSSMDIVLVPSTLNLTSELIRRTAGGLGASTDEEEVLQRETHWDYTIPPLNRDEFYYQGTLADETPPIFTPLTLVTDQSDCFVRQLPGRQYNHPAFEILFDVRDEESLLNLTLSVGTFSAGEDVLPAVEIEGRMLTVHSRLIPATNLVFTITSTNQNGLQSLATCSFLNEHFYDRSPPLVRINPVGAISSHPSTIQALVAVFDEVGLRAEGQEVAIGTVPGERGRDVMDWIPFNATLIDEQPALMSSILERFSYARVSGYYSKSGCGKSGCGRHYDGQIYCGEGESSRRTLTS